jgi:hypothetical protein
MHHSIPQDLKLSVYHMVGMNKNGLKPKYSPTLGGEPDR